MNTGIIGFGHLGEALAAQLIRRGLGMEELRISCSGSPSSLARIETLGLKGCLVPNQTLAEEVQTLVLAVRPGQLAALSGLRLDQKTQALSALAGVEIHTLAKIIPGRWGRIMPSSPTTMESGQGICAFFPAAGETEALIRRAGLSPYPLESEETFHLFTALVCLPAVFLEAERRNLGAKLPDQVQGFSLFSQVVSWALAATPRNLGPGGVEAFITRMATPGGVTEAMVGCIRAGGDLGQAMETGMARSQEIAREVNSSL